MRSRQTLLLVEDNGINRKILNRMLAEEYDILEAGNGQEAIEILETNTERISAILLDIIMPVMNGFEVLAYLKKEGITQLPIVVMTGESDEQSEEKALDLGAWDFVAKPYKPKILETRLKNAIARSRMSYLDQITHIAEHDQLTGFYNRRHFFEVTEKLIQKHASEKTVFVRVDINQFRLVNSFLGEAGGDALLRYLATEIQEHLKNYPWYSYGRIESDIFGFYIPYEKEQFEELLEDLIERLRRFEADFIIEPSFGIFKINDTTLSVESMFLRASMAAKACKNKYLVYYDYFDDKLEELQKQEQEIVREMQHALDNQEFLVYYQPKYNTNTQTPYGAEALVRWKSPEKGMISPGKFIPVFEKNGLIGKLDYYVWSKVCEQIKKWLEEGIELAPISVNMSRAELANPKLVEMLKGLIEQYEIPSRYLHLELTESAYMDNPEAMKSVIEKLHQAGFTILMDDFGSGYSSLNTLKDIDVDILKIDMKFLTLDDSNTKSKKILASIIGMAQWIGLPIITEGVETEEQFCFLQSIGCEYIQGYYFSRPIPLEEYDTLVRTTKVIEAISIGNLL